MHSVVGIAVAPKADSLWTVQKLNHMAAVSPAPSERGSGLWSLRRRYIPRPELATCVRHNSVSKLSPMCSDHGAAHCIHAMPPDPADAAKSNIATGVLINDIQRLLSVLEEAIELDLGRAGRNATIQKVQRLAEEVCRPGMSLETADKMPHPLQDLLYLSIRSCVDDLLLPKQVPLLSSGDYEDLGSGNVLDEDPWEGYEDIASEDFLEWLVDGWSGHEPTGCNTNHSTSNADVGVAGGSSQALVAEPAIA